MKKLTVALILASITAVGIVTFPRARHPDRIEAAARTASRPIPAGHAPQAKSAADRDGLTAGDPDSGQHIAAGGPAREAPRRPVTQERPDEESNRQWAIDALVQQFLADGIAVSREEVEAHLVERDGPNALEPTEAQLVQKEHRRRRLMATRERVVTP